MKRIYVILVLILLGAQPLFASKILIPMDNSQTNHLKAYGIAYWVLSNKIPIEWLLNYRGGSFMMDNYPDISKECSIRGVSYQIIADVQANQIYAEIADPEVNMERVRLEVAPKIAVYTPEGKLPWDDAVTLVMTYAEIPYDKIYDEEIIRGDLAKYDWLHLHHEDFTGQYGKFYRSFKNAAWYIEEVRTQEAMAKKLGFTKVSKMKEAVAVSIRNFVLGGGFLFTMCSGTDSFDIALAAEGVDIVESVFDGDPSDPQAQAKLRFDNAFAFQNYRIEKDPNIYEFSDIDGTEDHNALGELKDFFTLFDFSAKWDIVPTILTQNHTQVIKGFMGQTTSFRSRYIKSNVTIMGETKSLKTAKYIHGELGQGQWTYYGGHDPEDYRHLVGDPPTDLALHPNSPGYRLILNNILFPAAKREKQKT
ncbi:MAG TPA: asparagine synthetase B [Flavobacteriales bacterium]